MSNPSVTVELLLNSKKFKVRMAQLNASIKSSRLKTLGSSFGKFNIALNQSLELLGKVARAANLVVAGVMKIAEASDQVSKSQWKFDIIFKEASKEANKAASEIAGYFGKHISRIQKSMSTVADVLKPAGASEEQALQLAKSLAILGQGAEEWTQGRYDARTATEAFMKALVGEREMLKEMGIVIREADVKGYIKEQGWAQSELNKMFATYNLILQRSVDLQTSIGSRLQEYGARLMRFQEMWFGLQASIGDFVKPITTELLYLGSVIFEKLSMALDSEKANTWKDIISKAADEIREMADKLDSIDISDLMSKFGGVWDIYITGFKETLGTVMNYMFLKFGELGYLIGQELYRGIQDGTKRGAGDIAAQLAGPSGLGLAIRGVNAMRSSPELEGLNLEQAMGNALVKVGENINSKMDELFPQKYDVYPGDDVIPQISEAIQGAVESAAEKRKRIAEEVFKAFASKLDKASTGFFNAVTKHSEIQAKIAEVSSKRAKIGVSGLKEFYTKMLTSINDEDPTQKKLTELKEQEKEAAIEAQRQRNIGNQLLKEVNTALGHVNTGFTR